MVNRRKFLGLISFGAIAAVFRPEKWVATPLPPPPPIEVDDFKRIVVPAGFYSHVRRITLVNSELPEYRHWDYEPAAEVMAKQIADEIEFEIFKGKPND